MTATVDCTCKTAFVVQGLYTSWVDGVDIKECAAHARLHRIATNYLICRIASVVQGLYTSWVDDPPGNCPEPVSTCVTKPGGLFCPTRQPDWSAFRYTAVPQ